MILFHALVKITNFFLPAVFVNGKFCKDPNLATADDFFLSGMDIPRSISSPVGSKVTLFTADQIPGLNTLGSSLARLDFAPYGVNPPHTHPRATEVLVVLEGTLYVGFVTSNPDHVSLPKFLIREMSLYFQLVLFTFRSI